MADKKYTGALDLAKENSELRDLLKRLVSQVDSANQPDMLDGYLNDIGEEFNKELEELGLPIIYIIGDEE